MNVPKWGIGVLLLLVVAASIAAATGAVAPDGENGGDAKDAVDRCIDCHLSSEVEAAEFEEAYGDWLAGPHGNFERPGEDHDAAGYTDYLRDPSTEATDFTGSPDRAELEEELEEHPEEFANATVEDCTDCHGPSQADNRGVATLGLVDREGNVVPGDQAARLVVGCGQCHEEGDSHLHAANPDYEEPTAEVCGTCHGDDVPEEHLEHHPGARGGGEDPGIYEAYNSSPHAEFVPVRAVNDPGVEAICAKCHTDQGAERYRDVDGNHSTLVERLGDEPRLRDFSNVQCRTCHDPHDPEKLLEPATGNESAQYRTCTNCHQLTDDNGTVTGFHDPTANDRGQLGTHERVITDTHRDDPGTDAVEGYVLDPADDDACTDCHNQHSADLEKNRQWARSGHGGHLLDQKDRGRDHTTAGAWAALDFKDKTGEDDRKPCQRCHTSTGFKNFATDPANYTPENNTFAATGKQREMLYCWACHESAAAGEPRHPGPMNDTLPYDSDRAPNSSLDASDLCLSCHSGRKSGDAIDDADRVAGKHFGDFDAHYLAAGGVLYRTAGYRYPGATYTSEDEDGHGEIGTPAQDDTGHDGPCVSCHMGEEKDHRFDPVRENTTGHAAEIRTRGLCDECHDEAEDTPEEMTPEELNHEREEYRDALAALEEELGDRGIHYDEEEYPYFFDTQDPAGFQDAYRGWSDRGVLGAAHNLNLLRHEPAAYLHNDRYAKRLVYDSIDYLQHGRLTGEIDLSGHPDAAEWLEAEGNGGDRP